ncbi:MAG: hypothetical protein ACOYYJ_11930 [Chloroflexota bacterium]
MKYIKLPFVGMGYYKAPNEASHPAMMEVNFNLTSESERPDDLFPGGLQIMLGENKDFRSERNEGDDNYGTRAESIIYIKIEEAISLAEWILETIDQWKKIGTYG